MDWRGLLSGASNFANNVNGILYPGVGYGSDPQAQRIGRAQAMTQMGAGIMGGQPLGTAYGLGAQAGQDPIENARRQAYMDMATKQNAAQLEAAQLAIQDHQRKAKADEATRLILQSMPEASTPEQRIAYLTDGGMRLNRVDPGAGAQLLQQANMLQDNIRADQAAKAQDEQQKWQRQYQGASLSNMAQDNVRANQQARMSAAEANFRIQAARAEQARQRVAETSAAELALVDANPGLLNDPKRRQHATIAEGRYKGVTGKDYRTPQEKLYAQATAGAPASGGANARGGTPALPEGAIVNQGGITYKIINGKAVPQ